VKKILLILVMASFIAAGFAAAPRADAGHNSHGWYWSERMAGVRVNGFPGVTAADCYGVGAWRFRAGRYLYSHFYCSVRIRHVGGRGFTLHVTGRRRCRLLYDWRTTRCPA
jgi:hypothetical protein